jgi:hypothetical protein
MVYVIYIGGVLSRLVTLKKSERHSRGTKIFGSPLMVIIEF